MKLTAILLTVACLQVYAKGSAQITLSEKKAPLEKVLKAIKQQSGYALVYDVNLVQQKSTPVDIIVNNVPVDQALRIAFENQPLTYEITDKKIILVKEKVEAPKNVSAVEAPPVPIDISGKITDKEGNPLNGASVKVKGTNKGTTTGSDGVFVLKGVEGNAMLEISFVGYEGMTVGVNNRTAIVASLVAATTALQDVVVSKGYYSTTQRLNTGNVVKVTGETINKQPVTDPIQALIGQVAGVNIQQASGMPGAYGTIIIRGQNSMANGNDPLYIVDGVPFSSVSLTSTAIGGGALGRPGAPGNANAIGAQIGSGGGMSPFNSLNPSDIESIDILKDADATAIYGSRGANGVILITTKIGKAGSTRFDVNVYTGSGKVTRTLDLLNTQQYLMMRREAFKNDGIALPSITTNPADFNYDLNGAWDTTRYTDWQKVLIGNTATFTNAQVSLSGGNNNTQFLISGGYSKQGTVFLGNYPNQKASVHANITHTSANEKLHVLFTAAYESDNSVLPQVDFATNMILASPDAPSLYSSDGSVNWQSRNGTATFNNPLGSTLQVATAITNSLVSNLTFNYRLFDGLEFKASAGYTHSQMNQSLQVPAISYAPPDNNSSSNRLNRLATTSAQTWILEPQLNYKKNIAKGQLEVLVGTTFQQSIRNSNFIQASGFASDALISNPQAASSVSFGAYANSLYHYNALFGRISYNWQSKYLLNVTARRDGSSRFGPGKQFGNFGAIGTAWIFSKEKFVQKTLPFLSFAKLRASYGTTGNDQILDYQYLSTYSAIASTYQGITGLSPTGLTNPFFAWELVKKMEVGLDLGFLKDRILLSVDYYQSRTSNQLVGYSLPLVTGFNTIQYNLPAILQNSGIELSLNSTNIRNKNFTWTTSVNFTLPTNKLVAYQNLAGSVYKNIYVVGKSLFDKKVVRYTGVNPQTGTYSFITTNANGIPSAPQDLIATEFAGQKFYGGFKNVITYKNFQIDFLLQFVNQTAFNYLAYFSSPGKFGNQPTVVLNRWQQAGDNTNIQRFTQGGNSLATSAYSALRSNTTSDQSISDASFIRLKNVAISYQLPVDWQKKAHLQNARIYLQCQNLLTITKYLGLDPENGGLRLPPLRMITAGFQITF